MPRMHVRWLCCLCLAALAVIAGCNGAPSNNANDTANQPAAVPPPIAPTKQADLPPDWGSLKGRITLSGSPKPEDLLITRDVEYCGPFYIVDESTSVDEDNGGLANVLVYLYTDPGQQPPAPHESYAITAEDDVNFDNDACKFRPRMLAFRTTQTLWIKNTDLIAHTTFIPYEPDPINPTIPPEQYVKKKFPEATRLPLPVTCSVHSWMQARIMVLETPYFAVTDDNGEFEIPLLPPGEWTFQFYQEKFGFVNQVEYQGQRTRWEKGRSQFSIAGGKLTDLGEVKLKYADYEDSP